MNLLAICTIYSIDHAFIPFTNEIYRQGIGIPMDRNDASHIFFYTCMRKPFQDEIIGKLCDMFRYQDDMIVFGMHPQRNIGVHNIYPKEMIIKNTNLSQNKVTYLDLEITIEDNNYVFKSFDKRKDFNFPIVKYC